MDGTFILTIYTLFHQICRCCLLNFRTLVIVSYVDYAGLNFQLITCSSFVSPNRRKVIGTLVLHLTDISLLLVAKFNKYFVIRIPLNVIITNLCIFNVTVTWIQFCRTPLYFFHEYYTLVSRTKQNFEISLRFNSITINET